MTNSEWATVFAYQALQSFKCANFMSKELGAMKNYARATKHCLKDAVPAVRRWTSLNSGAAR